MNEIHKVGQCSELVSRIVSDVESAGKIYGNDIVNPLLCLISGIGAVIIIIKINHWLILWACVLCLISLKINVLIGKRWNKHRHVK